MNSISEFTGYEAVYKIKVANMLIIDSFDISSSDSKVTFNNIGMY